ncbi:MAG: SIMPL domain-containing protein [Candidatus Peregrinibacteria bacterium]
MFKHLNFTVLIATVISALTLVLIVSMGLGTYYKLKTKSTISVMGSVEKTITSDRAKWNIGISRTMKTTTEAVEKIEIDSNTIKQYFLDQGIKAGEMTFSPASSAEQTESVCTQNQNGQVCNNKFIGFTASQTITIESEDVNKIAELSEKASFEIAKKNISFMPQNPEYYYSYEKLKTLKVEVISLAGANARERAEEIALKTGAKIKGLSEASMGIFQITPINSTDFSDYGVYDTTTIDKKISVVLRATFVLE